MKERIIKKYPKIIEYLLVAYLGVVLIEVNLIDEGYKKHIILGTLAFSFISIRAKKWNIKVPFLSFKNFWEAFACYSLATLLGAITLYGYSIYFHKEWGASESTLLEYSLGIVIAQEILFRVFLWKLGQEIFGEKSIANIVLNTIAFASMHVVYEGFWQNYLWLLMMFAGALFAVLYYFYPKFYLVVPAHIILNATAVHFGIFH
jgi:hypothetical protein